MSLKLTKTNTYKYKTADGYTKGFFNIYQSRSGHIYIMMGDCATRLSLQ